MKTIKINEVNLKTAKSQCNFCGEGTRFFDAGKECVIGSIPFKQEKYEEQYERCGFLCSGHRTMVRVGMEDGEYASICLDCIVSMYPLVKSLREENK